MLMAVSLYCTAILYICTFVNSGHGHSLGTADPKHGKRAKFFEKNIQKNLLRHESGDPCQLLNAAQYAPFCPSTTPMVRTSNVMSCHRLQFRTYQASSCRRPSKAISLRPLTCQRPVMPGVVMQITW